MTVVVTSGKKFLDIDAYAGTIAYTELLNAQGQDAVAVSTAAINESVTPTAKMLGTNLQTTYEPDNRNTFVIIDVSEPDFLDKIVHENFITTVIDHHLGYEKYWQDKISDVDIELIGAACTQVYERWLRSGLITSISQESARLLTLGILDNTLNFKADVCTQRDRDAYNHLAELGDIPENWIQDYFSECEGAITADIATSLENDTKTMTFPGYTDSVKAGQLVVWDAVHILDNILALVEPKLHFVNLVSIKEGSSYIITNDEHLRSFLQRICLTVFDDNFARTDRLWLRKEIMKAAIDKYSNEGVI